MVGRQERPAHVSGDRSTAAARSLILGRIRDILGERAEAPDAARQRIPREYRAAPARTIDGCLDLLTERLLHYQVAVYRCAPSAVADTVAATLSARGRRLMVVPPDINPAWLPPGMEFRPDDGLSFDALDRCDGVLTGCSLAIANTGTIVLCHGPGEGRRAVTLIPDYHLCVVHPERVVETVPEAIRQLAAARPALVTTISGPSATADIEMTRIRGVHGPRTLDVILAAG